MPPAQFKLILDSIIWGIKHPMRNISDISLNTLYELLQNTAKSVAAQSFYQAYYTDILQHIFSVVTDSSQAAGMSIGTGV